MLAWPSDLPQKPLGDAFSETPPNLVVRSDTDVGPAKVRRRATTGVTKMKAVFHLTTAQLNTFRAFFFTDIAGGALSFDWTHPVTGAPGRYRIVPPPTYEAIANGLAWKLTLDMELLP